MTAAKDLTLDVVQTQLTPKQRLLVDEKTISEIHKLAEDPDYGEEFLDSYLTHLEILKNATTQNHRNYLNAIKFFTLVESDNSLTDAYIKVFPERYEQRKQNHPPEEQDKSIMRSEASRFNKSVLVNEIRRVAAIPVQLIHRHLLNKAILVQAELMQNARSEMVKQKAAQCLITELKPAEDQQINVKVDDNTGSVIEELRKTTERLAAQEHQFLMAGGSMKQVAESNIIDVEAEEIDE